MNSFARFEQTWS